ncbi:MAG TPA: helix-turn-helix transcriptional regulator [Pseudobdellovibrionaceae bacterium]|nr:helix-turn-helix transcriptional regulator [Pseudobdellovibrionaceae bacterium]
MGPVIADLLGHKNRTQAHIADDIGMSRAQISNFLNGHRDVHASTFVEILNALGIDVMKLIRMEAGSVAPQLDSIPQQLKLLPGDEVETLVNFLRIYKRRLVSDLETARGGQEIA